MSHGRYLSGFGSNDTQPAYAADQDRYVESLEGDDDVNGSGVFDAYGRQPTVNATLGVFQDHPSIPGYIDREVEYAVSREVVDITSGADVVTVAGGGLTYQERGGLPVPFDRTGRGPSRPAQYLSAAKNIEDVYVGLTDEPRIPPQVIAPVMPDLVISGPSAAPPAKLFGPPPAMTRPGQWVPAGQVSVVGQPSSVARVPALPAASPALVGAVNTSLVSDVIKPIAGPNPVLRLPRPTPVSMPGSTYTPPASTSSILRLPRPSAPAPRRTSTKGFGADDSSPGVGTYAVAGLLVGVAAAMVWHASKGKFGGAQ